MTLEGAVGAPERQVQAGCSKGFAVGALPRLTEGVVSVALLTVTYRRIDLTDTRASRRVLRRSPSPHACRAKRRDGPVSTMMVTGGRRVFRCMSV